MRCNWPARQPSPKKWPTSRRATTASFRVRQNGQADGLWFAKTSEGQSRPQPHGPSRLFWTMVVRVIRIARFLIILASRHRSFALENLALRQQLAVYQRTHPKPTVRWSDRLFWVGLRLAWPDWKSALVIVRPATVVAWHRRGFEWYWTRRSRPKGGRPQVDADVRHLTPEMARANPLWGAPRIHGELLKLGFEVSERTISRLMPRRRTRSSQTWRTFLENHLGSTVAIDSSRCPRSAAGSYSSSWSWPTTGGASCMSM